MPSFPFPSLAPPTQAPGGHAEQGNEASPFFPGADVREVSWLPTSP